jgi:formamidopyrimidine-DNA glycosylase
VRVVTPAFAVSGRLVGVDVVGKHLLYDFGERVLHVHLGAHGRVVREGESRSGLETWWVHDPATCALVGRREVAALRRRLGPDPLRADADPDVAWRRLHARTRPVADALADQAVVAGTGNRLRSEVLHALRLHPLVETAELDRATFDRLWDEVGNQMRRELAEFTDEPRVYRQKRCRRCGTPVHRVGVHGRTVYFCPACQHR